ncbi:uroporphyrinogen-III synthase [Sessilibacter corallicola]
MTIWLTRPKAQAAKTHERLVALGYESIWSQPLMEIIPVAGDQQRQKIRGQVMDLDLYHIAIFVSQNAVQFAFDVIDDFWLQLPLNTEFFAVGSATARALTLHGVNAESGLGEAMDSESLLMLPQLNAVDGLKVVIFRGLGGRTKLADELISRGACVDYCELYERVYPSDCASALAASQFGNDSQDITLVYSGESLQNLQRSIVESQKTHVFNTAVVVPGARVAAMAKSLGFTTIFEAKNASEEAMITTMTQACDSL